MKLYLSYYPKELVGLLKYKTHNDLIQPVLEVPDFKHNLNALYSLICEFFMFVKRENRELDFNLTEYDYIAEIPLNPKKWLKQYPELDLEKFTWFVVWECSEIIKQRFVLLDTLEENGIISIKGKTSKSYKIKITNYPQLEALRHIQMVLLSLMEDTGSSLYELRENNDIKSPLPHYFVQQGLVKVGYNVYTLTYTFNSEIILNNRYLISKLNYGSVNDQFFEYIFQHPKEKITRKSIEGVLGVLDRPISKIVYDIGFSGEMKKLFFPKVSNNSVFLNNPVTRDDLLNIEVEEKLLLEQLKGLKTIHSNTV